MHYRARSYDPRTGRFVQKEPIVEDRPRQGALYAANNPLTNVDPSGQRIEFDPKVTGAERDRIERYIAELQFWSVRIEAKKSLAETKSERAHLDRFSWIPDLIYYMRHTEDVVVYIRTARAIPGAWGLTSGTVHKSAVDSIIIAQEAEVTLPDSVGLRAKVVAANAALVAGGRARRLTEEEVGKETLVHEFLHVLLAARVAYGKDLTEDMAQDSFFKIFKAVESTEIVRIPLIGRPGGRFKYSFKRKSYEETRGFEYFVGQRMTGVSQRDITEQERDLAEESFTYAWRALTGGQ